MCRFNQRSVTVQPEVGRPGKGWTAQTRMDRASVQPPNLVQPPGACAHERVRECAGVRTHTRTRVQLCTFRLDKVRRLDRARQDKAFRRLTSRPTFAEVGR